MILKKRISINKIKKKKKIVCLTAYTKPIAEIADKFADILLVGDSLGPVLYGFDSTREVDLKLMINHAKAVVRSTQNSLIVVDMPYGTYEFSREKAYDNAKQIIDSTGADAVKVEGGIEIINNIKFLIKKRINVMGHIGMLPQKMGKMETPKIYGKKDSEKKKINYDLQVLESSGVFAIVIEATSSKVVDEALKNIKIPTIGIGASNKCRGQILVTEDLLGLTTFNAKFLKKFTNLSKKINTALKKYSKEIKSGQFPDKTNMYK